MTWTFGSAALALILIAVPVHAQNTAAFPEQAASPPSPTEAIPTVPPSVTAAPSVDTSSLPETAAPEPVAQRQPVVAPSRPPTRAAEAPRETTRWYGWQTLITDGAALTFLFAIGATDGSSSEDVYASAALGTYLLGGPIVHAAHGNWGRAVGSLGLRAGAPVLGATLGSSLEDCHGGDFCGLAGAVIGGTLGVLAAVTIDSAALARDTVREAPSITPMLGTGKNGTWVGVAGRF